MESKTIEQLERELKELEVKKDLVSIIIWDDEETEAYFKKVFKKYFSNELEYLYLRVAYDYWTYYRKELDSKSEKNKKRIIQQAKSGLKEIEALLNSLPYNDYKNKALEKIRKEFDMAISIKENVPKMSGVIGYEVNHILRNKLHLTQRQIKRINEEFNNFYN